MFHKLSFLFIANIFISGLLIKSANAIEAPIVDLEIQEVSKFSFMIKTAKQSNENVYKGIYDQQKEGITIADIIYVQADAIADYLCRKNSLLTTQKFNFKINYANKKKETTTITCKQARAAMVFVDGFSSYKKRVVDRLYQPINSYEVPVPKAEVITSLADYNKFYCGNLDSYNQNLSSCQEMREIMK